MRGVARAPGTCGELIQGTINGVNFHVTCPVDMYSVVEVMLRPGQKRVTVSPQYGKVAEAVVRTMVLSGIEGYDAEVLVHSQLPVGKGMASSTADITAACVATAEALGVFIPPEDISGLALAIEPSDGIMYSGLVLFDHVAGKLYRGLEEPPPIKLLVIDPGGFIDTGEFNARTSLPKLNRQKENTIRQALKLMEEGLTAGDPYKIGLAATMSAIANQQTIFKPDLENIINIARGFGAFGVNAAHSGTVIGILYDDNRTDIEALTKELIAYNKAFQLIGCSLTGGGAEIPVTERGKTEWEPYNTSMAATSGQRQQSMG